MAAPFYIGDSVSNVDIVERSWSSELVGDRYSGVVDYLGHGFDLTLDVKDGVVHSESRSISLKSFSRKNALELYARICESLVGEAASVKERVEIDGVALVGDRFLDGIEGAIRVEKVFRIDGVVVFVYFYMPASVVDGGVVEDSIPSILVLARVDKWEDVEKIH